MIEHSDAGTDEEMTPAEYVVERLEKAGTALLSLPLAGYSTRLAASRHEIVRDAIEAYGYTEARVRPPRPTADQITRMDEALAWIPSSRSSATYYAGSSACGV